MIWDEAFLLFFPPDFVFSPCFISSYCSLFEVVCFLPCVCVNPSISDCLPVSSWKWGHVFGMTKTRVENARLKRLNIMSNWYQKIIFFRSEMPGLVLEGNFHFCEQEYIECSPQEFSLRKIQLLRNNCFAEVSFYMLIWAINSHLIPWWWFSKGHGGPALSGLCPLWKGISGYFGLCYLFFRASGVIALLHTGRSYGRAQYLASIWSQ